MYFFLSISVKSIFSDVFNQTHCIVVAYNYWTMENFEHIKIWQSLQFTPQFVSKMRYVFERFRVSALFSGGGKLFRY